MNGAALERIWVDLLPLQAGGVNGGAKPFILELLAQLTARHPDVQFCCSVQRELAACPPNELRAANLRYQAVSRRPWKMRPRSTQLLFCPFGPPSVPSRGLPVVSVFYDLQVLAYPNFFSPAERRQRLRHLRQLQQSAQRIAAISEFSRQEGLRQGLDRQRLRTIPIQIPPPTANTANQPPLHLTSGGYLLYPANLWPHKNHELLFTAFAMACAQGLPPDLKLVCTGDGLHRRESLQQLCQGLQITERVLLPGYVSPNALQALYTHGLAVVFPSLYEGFGMPVIEAMARRIPVCCSNTTALSEVAGDAALLVDPRHPQQIATALVRLATDATLRQQLMNRGLQQAQQFLQPSAMADAYWRLFEEAHRAGPLR